MPSVDLEHWKPEAAEFGFRIVLFIGTEENSKCDAFDAYVCTPGFFASRMTDDGIISGQYIFFMRSFDYRSFRMCVEEFLNRCEGKSWPEVAKKVSHMGAWEFDDFSTQATSDYPA
jgi:hypothetical protein